MPSWKAPVLAAALAGASFLGCVPPKKPEAPNQEPITLQTSMCDSSAAGKSMEGWLLALKTSEGERECAVEKLGEIGKPAVPGLIQALLDPDRQVRLAAVDALERVGLDSVGLEGRILCHLSSKRYEEVLKLAAGPERGATIDTLGTTLERHAYLRGDAAMAAGRIGDPKLLTALMTASGDKNGNVREAAVVAIGQIAEKNPGDARVLGMLPTLWMVLKGENACCGWPVLAAVQTIGKIAAANPGNPELAKAIPWIIETILDDSLTWRTDAGADALAKIGKPAVPALLGILNSGKHRKVAAMALEKIGYENIGLREKLTCALLLGKTGWIDVYLGKNAVPELTGLLKDADGTVRMRAAQTLGRLKAASALPELRIMAQSEQDASARSAAIEAVSAITSNQER